MGGSQVSVSVIAIGEAKAEARIILNSCGFRGLRPPLYALTLISLSLSLSLTSVHVDVSPATCNNLITIIHVAEEREREHNE